MLIFLSHGCSGPIQVHENANIVISDMDYLTISFAKTGTQWFYLPGDATSRLGSSTGWNFSKQTPSKTSPPPRLLQMYQHTGPVETHNKANLVHVSHQQLWCEICWMRACGAPYCVHKRKILTRQGLDRRPLLQDQIKLGLQCAHPRHFHAGAHQKITFEI
jgi:hypothetical protein